MKVYPIYAEDQEVATLKSGVRDQGATGKVVQNSGTNEKYVHVQWENNRTWIEKSCITPLPK